jgi:ATP-binding cassette subfamily F protein 3
MRVGDMSGGERARLALALITRDAPHLLILDEPTNHLDVDAREALVQALNGYDGAVILISHDRHMVELTADRLVLVDDGQAIDYPGSIDDYIDFILGRNQPKIAGAKAKPKKLTGQAKDDAKALRQAAADAEAASAKLAAECEALDRELALVECAKTITDLSRRRAQVADDLAKAEAHWLEVSEQLEQLAA